MRGRDQKTRDLVLTLGITMGITHTLTEQEAPHAGKARQSA